MPTGEISFHELDVVTRWRRDGKRTAIASFRFLVDRLASKTASTIKSFFLAATLHPEVVKLAQKELDEVTGGDRLPDFSDMPQLPYISAIVKEVLRWRPPTPIGKSSPSGLLHVKWAEAASGGVRRVMEDDVYNGQLIPAGTTMMSNTWYVARSCGLLWKLAESLKGQRFATNRCTLMHMRSILAGSSKMARSIPT